MALVGCADDDQTPSASTASESTSTQGAPASRLAAADPVHPAGGMGGDSTSTSPTARSPRRPAGPYPGDGSNGVNVLSESGIVRSDLTSSFGSASGVAEGVPVTVKLKVYDLNGADVTPLSGAAVYLWHCDREGNYSLYSEAVADENFLRGVQETDADGTVHVHHHLPGLLRRPLAAHALRGLRVARLARRRYTNKLRTSQLAIPEDICREVYGIADGYDASVANLDAGQPGQRHGLHRRLLAPAGDRDRVGRRGLHVLPQRAGLVSG